MTDSPRHRFGYDELLSLAREDLRTGVEQPPPESFVLALRRARRSEHRRIWLVTIALLLAMAVWIASIVAHPIPAPLCPHLDRRDVFEMGVQPAISLGLSIVLLRRRHVGAQMFVRACCWSYLLLGALSTLGSPGLLPWVFPALALACGASLLVLGEHGLEPERYRGTFVPVRHRAALTWAMILAVADMQTLLAVNQANTWMHPTTNACSVGMVVAVVGLYRLRAWGLWLNSSLNLLIAGLVLTGNLAGVPTPLAATLAATAAIQVALVIPLARAILRGHAEDEHSSSGIAVWVMRSVVVVTMTVTLMWTVRGSDPDRLAEYCAAQIGLVGD